MEGGGRFTSAVVSQTSARILTEIVSAVHDVAQFMYNGDKSGRRVRALWKLAASRNSEKLEKIYSLVAPRFEAELWLSFECGEDWDERETLSDDSDEDYLRGLTYAHTNS